MVLDFVRHNIQPNLQNNQLRGDLSFVCDFLHSVVSKDDEMITIGFYSLIMQKINEAKGDKDKINKEILDAAVAKRKKMLKYYEI